eukprot:129486_1
MGNKASKRLNLDKRPTPQWVLLDIKPMLDPDVSLEQPELKLVDKWPEKQSIVAREMNNNSIKDERAERDFYVKTCRQCRINGIGGWEMFRHDNQARPSASQTIRTPSDGSFVVAEYHRDAIGNLIPESLHAKLLNQLMRLSKDKTIQYDVRNAETGTYNKPIASNDAVDFQNAIIHDLIDPSKNLMDHLLWIPSVFHVDNGTAHNPSSIVRSCSIQSQILNLDVLKYRDIYRSIGQLFEKLIPCFEKIEKRKLGGNEKVIVKSLDYILHQQGDVHHGKKHFEGMGEYISSVAIFYPFVDSGIEGGDLNIGVIGFDGEWRNISLPTKQGTVVVLSNECYHNLVKIEYPVKNDESGDAKRALSRKLIVLMLIEKGCNIPTTQSVNNEVVDINMQYNTEYIINAWCRNFCMKGLSCQIKIIESYICGNWKYVYENRSRFRYERMNKSPSRFFCMV